MIKGGELRLALEGLHCAQCSVRIEEAVAALPEVSSASVDVVAGRLRVAFTPSGSPEELLARVRTIVSTIEPGVVVAEEGGPKAPASFPKGDVVRLTAAAILWLAAILAPLGETPRLVLYGTAYLLAGVKVLRTTLGNLRRGSIFDEFFLMTVATGGAFLIGEFSEAVAVMLFYETGEFIQDLAVERSRQSILSVMDIRPDRATLIEGDQRRVVPAADVHPGQIILVKPGEKVPLDGTIIEGASSLDTSSLTGESLPADRTVDDEVLAGSVNLTGTFTMKVLRPFGETTLSKGLKLIEEARERKAPTERFITAFAKVYTPAVVILAAFLAVIPPLAGLGAFRTWGYRALVFLVISCPCALVISIPLALFGGMGAASRRGILIKGGNVLETMAKAKAVLFDKTGTLTRGVFKVAEVHPADHLTEKELLSLAALAERGSNHPVAKAVVAAAGALPDHGGQVEELPGLGVRLVSSNGEILAGNGRLLEHFGVAVEGDPAGLPGAVVHVAHNGSYAGFVVVEDSPREEARKAVDRLRALRVGTVGMLSGDRPENTEKLATTLGLDLWEGGLLPADKLTHFRRIKKGVDGTTLFVGDGLNDAPLLAAADGGFAMGGLGADAAIDAADGVFLRDDPQGVADGISIARRTRAIVWQNIAFALGVKGLVLIMGALGVATMWEAVFADVGVAVLATLNAARILRAD